MPNVMNKKKIAQKQKFKTLESTGDDDYVFFSFSLIYYNAKSTEIIISFFVILFANWQNYFIMRKKTHNWSRNWEEEVLKQEWKKKQWNQQKPH